MKEASGKPEDPPKVVTPAPEDTGKDKPVPETVESLTHKLSVLQGKYNSEIVAIRDDVNLLTNLKNQVRQMTGQFRDASGKLNEANLFIQDLQKQITEKPADTGGDNAKLPTTLLSAEDREHLATEGFDDRSIEIFGKMIKTLAPERAVAPAITDELEQIKRDVQNDRENTFWTKLSLAVPDWESVNSGDQFNDWLDEVLPYSDKTKRDVLKAAQAQLDYRKVIQIFTDFKAANPGTTKPKKEEPKYDPAKQIEPASSVTHTETPEGEKPQGKIYTREEVKQYYKEVATGKYKGKDVEAAKIDADIIKANLEGRIQG